MLDNKQTLRKWATAKTVMISIYVIAIIFVFLVTVFAPSYNSAKHNGAEFVFNDGWLYEDEEGNLTPFHAFGTELDDERIILIHEHDDSVDSVDAIAFYNYYSAVEVYVGERLIYTYGSLDDIQNGKLLGNYYSMVDIHGHHMEADNIKVVFLNTQPQTVYGFRAGSGAALEMAMIREYIPSLITPILTFLFLLVSLVIGLKEETRDLITNKHKWLIVFAVAISFWEIADSQLLMDMNLRAGTVCLLSFEAFMLLPIPLLMLIYHCCKKLRIFDIVMCGVVFVNFIVLNILNFLKISNFLNSLFFTHCVIAACIVLVLIQVILEFERQMNRDNWLLLIGYLLFVCSAIIQYMQFFANPTESNSKVLQIGALLFLAFEVSDVFATINDRIHQVAQRLEKQTAFLKQTFKTLVPDDVDRLMLESKKQVTQPNALLGSMRNLTVLESDIRGFSEFIQGMTADQAIDMLNHYLGVMTNILRMHDGIVLEFVGDAILAIFDEKNAGENHAEKAVFAAVEMQLCMKDIQAWNRKRNYPEFEMGIGIATGQAYVGYIGSESRMEYDAIGTTVNLGSRIESYSTGGQILISKSCRDSIEKDLIILGNFKIAPKGYSEEIEVFLIGGIGEPYNLICVDAPEVLLPFEEPIWITYNMVVQKKCIEPEIEGHITEMSDNSATLVTDHVLKMFDNIRINSAEEHLYCKVVSKSEKGFLVRFTSVPNNFKRWQDTKIQNEERTQ